MKIKLKNCQIYNEMFYVDLHFYVFDDSELKIKIIKHIHEFSSKKYIEKLFIYDKINFYYY